MQAKKKRLECLTKNYMKGSQHKLEQLWNNHHSQRLDLATLISHFTGTSCYPKELNKGLFIHLFNHTLIHQLVAAVMRSSGRPTESYLGLSALPKDTLAE